MKEKQLKLKSESEAAADAAPNSFYPQLIYDRSKKSKYSKKK